MTILTIGKVLLGLCFLDAISVLVVLRCKYELLWDRIGPSTEMPSFLAFLYRISKIGRRGAFEWSEFPDDPALKIAWLSTGILGDIAVFALIVGVVSQWVN